jgi:hypothetical protein
MADPRLFINIYYLLLHREDGLPGGVEQHAAVADAEDGAPDPQHDGAVGVGDGEVAVGEADGLLGHRQRHHVRRAELRGHHRHRRRRRRRRRGGSVGRRHRIGIAGPLLLRRLAWWIRSAPVGR